MSFYEQISKYYDYIFPVGQSQIRFIEEILKNKASESTLQESNALNKLSIMDVACGSGGYSIELAKKGYEVTAVDIDEAMIAMAEEKMRKEKLNIDILKCDIRELKKTLSTENADINQKDDEVPDAGKAKLFDCIFCIGNSIVHLGGYGEILQAVKQMKDLLANDGVLVLQVINYDRIIKFGIDELPAIRNEKIPLEFIRKYEFAKGKGLVNFNTRLTIGADEKKEEYINSIELYPIRSGEMLKLLYESGFTEIEFYGDFDKSPYKEDSFMLVVKAIQKAK